MKRTIYAILVIVFCLSFLSSKTGAESVDPIPTIPLSANNSGTINFQVDDLSIYSKTKLVYLKNLTASEVEPFIRSRLSKFGTVQINDQENLLIVSEREPKLADIVNLIEDLDKVGKKDFLRLETETILVQFIKASKAKNIALQRLSSDGIIQADDDLNALVITDVKSKIAQFKEIIKLLDKPYKQVVIEAAIIEKSKSDDTRLGIDWTSLFDKALVGFNISKSKSKDDMDGTSSYTKSTDQKSSFSISTSLGSVLNTLDQKGDIKIVSTPKLVGVNNRTSEITTRSTDDLSIGLKIYPTIGNSDLITLDIEASVVNSNYPDNSSQEKIKSTIIAKNNESFIIGGLTKKSKEYSVKRFPVLGYILPYLFSKKIEKDVYSEIAFVITPHIVDAPVTSSENLKKLEEDIK